MKGRDEEKITDELIGQDEKVCSCSVRVAELLKAGAEERGGKVSLRQTIDLLRQKKGGQENG